jgi:HD superfamily phosphohydrolase YqeK
MSGQKDAISKVNARKHVGVTDHPVLVAIDIHEIAFS